MNIDLSGGYWILPPGDKGSTVAHTVVNKGTLLSEITHCSHCVAGTRTRPRPMSNSHKTMSQPCSEQIFKTGFDNAFKT